MTQQVNVSIIYYSSTGTVYELAQAVAEGVEKAQGEVRLLKVTELVPDEIVATNNAWSKHAASTKDVPTASTDDVLWADACIFGSPTRFGNVSSQLKQFFDTLGGPWSRGELQDKIYSGFTATSTAHGGQESTLLAMYNSFYHFGGIIVPPGYTDPVKFVDGNPYGTSHVSGQGDIPVDDAARDAARHQGRRVVTTTRAFLSGRVSPQDVA